MYTIRSAGQDRSTSRTPSARRCAAWSTKSGSWTLSGFYRSRPTLSGFSRSRPGNSRGGTTASPRSSATGACASTTSCSRRSSRSAAWAAPSTSRPGGWSARRITLRSSRSCDRRCSVDQLIRRQGEELDVVVVGGDALEQLRRVLVPALAHRRLHLGEVLFQKGTEKLDRNLPAVVE